MKDPIKLTLFSDNPDFPCEYTVTIGNEDNEPENQRMIGINRMCNAQLLRFAVKQKISCLIKLNEAVRILFLSSMQKMDNLDKNSQEHEDEEHLCSQMVLCHIGLRNLILGDVKEFGDISLNVDFDYQFESNDYCYCELCLEDDE